MLWWHQYLLWQGVRRHGQFYYFLKRMIRVCIVQKFLFFGLNNNNLSIMIWVLTMMVLYQNVALLESMKTQTICLCTVWCRRIYYILLVYHQFPQSLPNNSGWPTYNKNNLFKGRIILNCCNTYKQVFFVNCVGRR